MLIEHRGKRPRVHQSAYIAPTATLSGDVVVGPVEIGARAEVRINGTVHLMSRLPPDTTVPIGWVAVGDPAEIRPANEHDEIWAVQEKLDFPGTVFGLSRPAPGKSLMPELTRRYARALARHKDDRIIEMTTRNTEP